MGGKTETTTKSKTNPAKWMMPHINTVLGESEGLYEGGQPTFAPLSGTTQTALGGIENRAAMGSPVHAAGREGMLGTIRGDFLSPESNPHLKALYDLSAREMQDRVNAEFSKAGRYSSGAHQEELQEGLRDLATSIYAPAYERERGRMFGATLGAPQFAEQDFTDYEKMLRAGAVRDTQAQREIDDPYQRIQRYLSIIRGVPQGRESFGKTTKKESPGALDWLEGIGGFISDLSSGAQAAAAAYGGA